MTRTIAEMAAQRDPLYAAMVPTGEFEAALWFEYANIATAHLSGTSNINARDTHLLKLAVRALRNQRQPYYDD